MLYTYLGGAARSAEDVAQVVLAAGQSLGLQTQVVDASLLLPFVAENAKVSKTPTLTHARIIIHLPTHQPGSNQP